MLLGTLWNPVWDLTLPSSDDKLILIKGGQGMAGHGKEGGGLLPLPARPEQRRAEDIYMRNRQPGY